MASPSLSDPAQDPLAPLIDEVRAGRMTLDQAVKAAKPQPEWLDPTIGQYFKQRSPGVGPGKQEVHFNDTLQAVHDGKLTLDQAVEALRPPTLGEQAKTAGINLINPVVSGTAGLVKGANRLAFTALTGGNEPYNPEAMPLGVAAEEAQGAVQRATEAIPPQAANQGPVGQLLTQTIPNVVGSLPPLLATGGAPVALAANAALQTGERMYEEAEAKGATGPKKWLAFAAGAGVGGTSMLALGNALAAAEVASPTFADTFQQIIKTAASPNPQVGLAANAALARLGENLAAKGIYDKDRQVFEGVVQSAEGGALTAFGTGVLHGLSGRRVQEMTQEAKPEPKAQEKPAEAAPAKLEEPADEAQILKDMEAQVEALKPVPGGEQPARTAGYDEALPEQGTPATEAPAVGLQPAATLDVPAEMPRGQQLGTDLTGEPVYSKTERGDLGRPEEGLAQPKVSRPGLYDEQGGLYEAQAEEAPSGKKALPVALKEEPSAHETAIATAPEVLGLAPLTAEEKAVNAKKAKKPLPIKLKTKESFTDKLKRSTAEGSSFRAWVAAQGGIKFESDLAAFTKKEFGGKRFEKPIIHAEGSDKGASWQTVLERAHQEGWLPGREAAGDIDIADLQHLLDRDAPHPASEGKVAGKAELQHEQERATQAEGQLAEREAKLEEEVDQQALREADTPDKVAEIKKNIVRVVDEFTDLTRGTPFSQGFLNPKIVAKTAEFAKLHIQLGVAEFEVFAKKAVEAMGERIRPYLAEAWSKARAGILKTTPSGGGVTGIKNRIVDAELAAMGRPPATHGERMDFEEANRQAEAQTQEDPHAGAKLMLEVGASPRPVTGVEDALLVRERNRLKLERNQLQRDLFDANQAADDALSAELRIKIANAQDAFAAASDIVTKVGTENALGLVMRRLEMHEDYSLAEMEQAERASTGGAPLTEKQTAEIKALHDKIAEAQKASDERAAADEVKRAQLQAENAILRMKKEPNKKPPARKAGTIEKFITDRAAEARARIKARGIRAPGGFDPATWVDEAIVGAEYLVKDIADFAAWSKAMLADLGEYVKPHLAELFEESKKFHARVKAGGPTQETSERAKTPEGFSREAQKIAKHFVGEGIEEREALIDAVYDVMRAVDPEITRRQVMDAISGYGLFKPLSQEEIAVKLRGMKGEMQQVAKLEDMEQGLAPLKTGPERRTPTDEERRLIQKVNETRKRLGIRTTDPATQLKSALDSKKTFLKNRINDLRHQIDTRAMTVKERTPAPSDAEVAMLKAEHDALKQQFEDIFGKPGMTEEQRLQAALKSDEKLLVDYEKRVAAGDISSKKKLPVQTVDTEAASVLRAKHVANQARLDALRQQIKELRDLANPKKTPEERALQAFKTRTLNATARLQEKLTYEDFSPRTPKAPLALDPEAQRIKAASESMKQEYRRRLLKNRQAGRTRAEKVQDALAKWRRAFVLSSPTTLAKLTSAGAERMFFAPVEEVVGTAISKAAPRLAARAPREGGGNVAAEAKALTEGFTRGMADAAQTLKTGRSELDVLYGKEPGLPPTAIDFFGHLHGALKAPTKRNEFARSFEKRTRWAMRNGLDASDPAVQTRIAVDAYKDASRSIFMQDNRVVSFYKRGLTALEQPNKATGKTPALSKAGATTLKVLLPIVKIPTNIVAETFQYALGSAYGSAQLARAYARGIESLPPEQADSIMRSLKKGSVGAAALALGFFGAGSIGGYYQPGKRSDDDVKFGSIRVFGFNVPSLLIHNPLLEVLQVGATIRRVAESRKKKRGEEQGLDAGVIAAGLGLVEEVPFVRETSEVAKVLDPAQREDALGRTVGSMVVPTGLSWLARQLDPAQRKAEGVIENIQAGLPGLRQQLPLKLRRKAK